MTKKSKPSVSRKRIRQIVRQFKENGFKVLLEHPQNVRELLNLLSMPWLDQIDLDRMTLVKTTFIRRDFRHVESDIVLVAPLLDAKGRRTRKSIIIYVLIEHQSEPDRLMPLRTLDYTVQIFNFQARDWARLHGDVSRIRLQPVLPVIFYSGTRLWDSPGVLTDIVERGEEFAEITPFLKPLYINLPALPIAKLKERGGFFGQVLRVFQQRKAQPQEFKRVLAEVVRFLEDMPSEERLRWLDLLSYLHAMVYHEREPVELEALTETIERSVQTDDHRQEIHAMGQTIAEKLIEEGRTQGMEKGMEKGELMSLRSTLVLQLRERFGEQADDVAGSIQQTKDPRVLKDWLKRFATARTIRDLRIQ